MSYKICRMKYTICDIECVIYSVPYNVRYKMSDFACITPFIFTLSGTVFDMAILNDLLNTALIKRVIGRFDMRYILYHMPFIMTAYDWRKKFTV